MEGTITPSKRDQLERKRREWLARAREAEHPALAEEFRAMAERYATALQEMDTPAARAANDSS